MLYEDTVFGPYETSKNKARKAFELYENGKIPQALLELDAALQINPSNSSWHFNKALALDAIDQFNEAINEYEIALQLDPNDLEILNSLMGLKISLVLILTILFMVMKKRIVFLLELEMIP